MPAPAPRLALLFTPSADTFQRLLTPVFDADASQLQLGVFFLLLIVVVAIYHRGRPRTKLRTMASVEEADQESEDDDEGRGGGGGRGGRAWTRMTRDSSLEEWDEERRRMAKLKKGLKEMERPLLNDVEDDNDDDNDDDYKNSVDERRETSLTTSVQS